VGAWTERTADLDLSVKNVAYKLRNDRCGDVAGVKAILALRYYALRTGTGVALRLDKVDQRQSVTVSCVVDERQDSLNVLVVHVQHDKQHLTTGPQRIFIYSEQRLV